MEKEMLEIPYRRDGSTLCYQMPKELDHHEAQKLCRELDYLIESYQIKELILDFSKTEFMDSSGIGVVIGRQKTMKFHQGMVCVKNLNLRTEAIFKAAGLFQIVKVKEEM
uniref:anti-sigma factor antagonist n=1 Tax=Agathobacter sp. TaxID=2021311 RepID=UPI0040579F49